MEEKVCMKILITGANGYLGKGVVKQLLNENYNVIATDFKNCRIFPEAIPAKPRKRLPCIPAENMV